MSKRDAPAEATDNPRKRVKELQYITKVFPGEAAVLASCGILDRISQHNQLVRAIRLHAIPDYDQYKSYYDALYSRKSANEQIARLSCVLSLKPDCTCNELDGLSEYVEPSARAIVEEVRTLKDRPGAQRRRDALKNKAKGPKPYPIPHISTIKYSQVPSGYTLEQLRCLYEVELDDLFLYAPALLVWRWTKLSSKTRSLRNVKDQHRWWVEFGKEKAGFLARYEDLKARFREIGCGFPSREEDVRVDELEGCLALELEEPVDDPENKKFGERKLGR
jgi:hypothetical protein